MEFEKFGFTEEEVILKLLRVHLPLPLYEPHRIRVLKETKILNSSRSDVRFDRFTQLCARVFSVSTPACEPCLIYLIFFSLLC